MVWHGALWRVNWTEPPSAPVRRPSHYAPYTPAAVKEGLVWRALTAPHSKAELMKATGLTVDQVEKALKGLQKAGRVTLSRRRRNQVSYRRATQED